MYGVKSGGSNLIINTVIEIYNENISKGPIEEPILRV